MADHEVVGKEEWERHRALLLAKEKEMTSQADDLARQVQALPWLRIETDYHFDTEHGPRSLRELFQGRSQLIVYHFMYGTDWDEGCPSCSFWADNFDGIGVHLAHRDVTLLAASTAPLDALLAYRSRMGWSFPWVSTAGSTFNRDFEVTGSSRYNYRDTPEPIEELPGLSVFALSDGDVFHTYSRYARGLDIFNGAYQLLDMVPKGRDESDLSWNMAWLRRHDAYAD